MNAVDNLISRQIYIDHYYSHWQLVICTIVAVYLCLDSILQHLVHATFVYLHVNIVFMGIFQFTSECSMFKRHHVVSKYLTCVGEKEEKKKMSLDTLGRCSLFVSFLEYTKN